MSAKLRGHHQYYGVLGNYKMLEMKATQLLHNLGQSKDERAKSFVKSWNDLMFVIASESNTIKPVLQTS